MADGLLDQFRKNYEYDHWANDRFLKALSEMAKPPEKAVQILAHILFARDIWLARLLKEDLSRFPTPWPPTTLEECGRKSDELHEKWRGYLESLKPQDLKGTIIFANTQGKRFEHIVQNVLTHVTHHSHYHRGQLASLVTQAGGNRPGTDYIGHSLEIGESKAL